MQDLRENLAEQIFDLWAGWMWSFVAKGKFKQDGSLTIPTRHVNRWYQLMGNTYKNLTNEDKELYRNDADKVLELINE